MRLALRREQVMVFADLPEAEQRRRLEAMSPPELLLFDADFETWAHDGQRPPPGEGWRTWLMMAGRGFGKTRAGAEWVHRLAMTGGKRIALVAASIDEARGIMVEGVSGILAVARRYGVTVKWEPSLNRLTWPKGSVATLFSGESPDGLRGPEHDFAWADELAKWARPEETWNNLQMGLRLGPRPRSLVTTTPRPMKLLERIEAGKWTVKTGGRTEENINLPPAFVEMMLTTYGGTRLGRQELEGKMLADVEGALWTREMIERCRSFDTPPLAATQDERSFRRIVVGVDPPAGAGEGCDACGIVVCGLGQDGIYTVLADESVQGLSPEGWAMRVALAAARWGADKVVAEANNGGAMVASVLSAADVDLPVKLVHASRGKCARAEPVALRFETGRARFAGVFPALEDELAGMTAGGGYHGPTRSPDRADAMVWAMTELAATRSGVPRVVGL